MRFGFRAYDAVFLVMAALIIYLYIATADGGFPLDDSWIHQTYGRNLAQTGQWAFVPGIPSAASTSPLYTVLLAVGYKLSLPFKLWTHTLGLLALAAAGMVGARMAEQGLSTAHKVSKKHPYAGLITGLALILAWHLVWAAASGMETLLFSALTLVLMWLAWRELNHRATSHPSDMLRGALFGILAGLTTLTRPEGLMLTGFIGVTMLIVRPQANRRAFLAWTISALAGFIVILSPYLLLNSQLTGGLLPNTAAAKQSENAPLLYATYPERIVNMLFPLIAGGQVLLLPGMIYFAGIMLKRVGQDHRTLIYLLPLVWALGLIGLYAARLPAPYQHGRYVIPALPSLIVVGAVGTTLLIHRGRSSPAGRVISRSLVIAAALAFIYFALGVGPQVYLIDVAIIDEEMVTAAHWIADHLPTDHLLVVHDIGAVGYFAPRPLLDLAGLVSPEVIPIILDEAPLWALMRQRDARYLMAFPDQVPGDEVDDPRLCPIFTTDGPTSRSVSGPSMTVYALTWDGVCSP
jgi:hypothetical protein